MVWIIMMASGNNTGRKKVMSNEVKIENKKGNLDIRAIRPNIPPQGANLNLTEPSSFAVKYVPLAFITS